MCSKTPSLQEDRIPSATPSLSDSSEKTQRSAVTAESKGDSETFCDKQTFVMTKKLVLPTQVRYKWQRGFRKINGSYAKVDFVRLELDYGTEFPFLPGVLCIQLMLPFQGESTSASAKHRGNKGTLYSTELTVNSNEKMNAADSKLLVKVSDVSGKDRRKVADSNKSCHVITEFRLCIDRYTKEATGQWNYTEPVLNTTVT